MIGKQRLRAALWAAGAVLWVVGAVAPLLVASGPILWESMIGGSGGSLPAFPALSHRTYVSENALMPGAGDFVFPGSAGSVRRGHVLDNPSQYIDSHGGPKSGVPAAILAALERIPGAEARILSTRSSHKDSFGDTVYAVLRARKGDGKEALVITSRYCSNASLFEEQQQALPGKDVSQWTGTSLVVGVLEALGQSAPWLARDIIFVATDAADTQAKGLENFLDDYFGPRTDMLRGGNIQAAFVVDAAAPMTSFSKLVVSLHGYNGRLPNLDLLNTVERTAAYRAHMQGNVALARRNIVRLPEKIDPRGESAALLTFMLHQARGVPTGDHGVFSRHHIDCLSLTPVAERVNGQFDLTSLATVVEGTLRSLNNLLERLHQSFYYYLLSSPTQYVSIGEYMIVLGLVLAGFGLREVLGAISLGYRKNPLTIVQPILVVVAITFLVGLPVYLIPTLAESEQVAQAVIGVQIGATLLALGVVAPLIDRVIGGGAALDAGAFEVFLGIPTLLFVGCLSLLNFSFCYFAATALMPILTFFRATDSTAVRFLQLPLLIALSPLALTAAAAHAFEVPILDLINTVSEEHEQFGTFLFPFMTLVYAPAHACLLRLVLSAKPAARPSNHKN